MEIRNRNPVTTDARPVLAPADTPAELSTKVVVVDVPSTAPAEVAIASARRAGRILSNFPSSSKSFALFATPIKGNFSSNLNNFFKIAQIMVTTINTIMNAIAIKM